jgi:hypothetical protein
LLKRSSIVLASVSVLTRMCAQWVLSGMNVHEASCVLYCLWIDFCYLCS